MATAVVLQSSYIPWKGYFDLVSDADVFIFYDDVQYTKNDWRNRNKLKTSKGVEWLSIPIGAHERRLICDVEIRDPSWQTKHWKTIRQNYVGCPYFTQYQSFFEDVYLGRKWPNLSALNQHLICAISKDFLGINTSFFDSRSYSPSGKKFDRLLDLVTRAGADRYVSGPAAKAYIQPTRFADLGIELVWKDYSGYPEYPQRFGDFEHRVSILDVLFNVGPDAAWYVWGWRKNERHEPA